MEFFESLKLQYKTVILAFILLFSCILMAYLSDSTDGALEITFGCLSFMSGLGLVFTGEVSIGLMLEDK